MHSISYNECNKYAHNRNTANAFQTTMEQPSRTVVHAKLEMTNPDSQEELEADAVANDIVQGGKIARSILAGSSDGGLAVSSQMEGRLNSLQGCGQVMPDGLRNMMESGFNRDFSQVRLHTGSEAASLSSSINAKAFTLGNDIYFNQGQFSPNTSEGQKLMAHELAHVVQGGGKVARQEGEVDNSNRIDEIKKCFAKGDYYDDDLWELLCYLEEHDFYRLLCTNLFDFNQIAKINPNLISVLANIHKDSFVRLRFSDKGKFAQLFTTKSGEGPDYETFPELLDINPYHLIEMDRDQLLGMTSEEKKNLTDDAYHYTRMMVEDAVNGSDTEKTLQLLKELNSYDFCDFLMKNEDFILHISDEDFLSLMEHHIRAVVYLYKKENPFFNNIFYDKFDLLEILGKKYKIVFIKDVTKQLLEQKYNLYKFCEILKKDIRKKIEENNKRHFSSFYEWFGNENLELEELYDIVRFVQKDLSNITADGSIEKNCAIYTTSFRIIENATKRLSIYIQNYQNGLEQYQITEYFVKTVCLAILSAGAGSIVGSYVTTQTVSQKVIADIVISTAVGGGLEITDELITGNINGKNMLQASGIGTAGAVVDLVIAHSTKVSGPFAKILIDVLFGTAGTIGVDTTRNRVPIMRTSEIHDDLMDAALYYYYADKIGGIEYDTKRKVYFVKESLTGKDGERQKNIVEKMNNLLIKLKIVELESFS